MTSRRLRHSGRAAEVRRRTDGATAPVNVPPSEPLPEAVEEAETGNDLPGLDWMAEEEERPADQPIARRVGVDDILREAQGHRMKMVKKRDLRAIIAKLLDQVLAERDHTLAPEVRKQVVEQARDHLRSTARHAKALEADLQVGSDERIRLAAELADWKARTEAAEADRGSLHARLADAEACVDAQRAEAEARLATICAEADTRTAALESDLATARAEVAALRRQSSGDGDQAKAAVVSAEARLAAAQARINHLDREARTLREDLDRARKAAQEPRELDGLRRAIADWVAAHATEPLAEKLRDLPGAPTVLRGAAELLRHLDAHLGGAQQRLGQAEARIEQLASSQAEAAVQEAELEAIEAENEQTLGKLAAVRAEREQLRRQVGDLEQRLAAAEAAAHARLAEQETAVSDLKAAAQEKERAEAARAAAQALREAERKRTAQLAAELGQRDERLAALQAEVDLLRADEDRVREARILAEAEAGRVAELEAALQRARADGIEIAERLKLKSKEFELATAGGRVEQLEQDLATARGASAQLQARLKERDAELERLRQELAVRTPADTADLTRLRVELEREREARRRTEATSRLMEAENALARAQARVERLREEAGGAG